MTTTAIRALETEVWRWLAQIPDPEIPAISITDLGIVREVRWDEAKAPPCLVVTVTPTYSGCPATEVIADAIREKLEQEGVADALVRMQLSPAWTTDWLAPAAKEKLRRYGIAPPAGPADEQVIDISRLRRRAVADPRIACPQCGSTHTELSSQFGSTPCKALYVCRACREPFDYFKPH